MFLPSKSIARMLFAPLLLIPAMASPALADCKSDYESFSKALAARDADQTKSLELAIRRDAVCAGQYPDITLQRADMLLKLYDDTSIPKAKREALLREAVNANVSWKASATLGDVEYEKRNYAEALAHYETALDLMGNRSLTPSRPSKAMYERVMGKAGGAKQLASNDQEGEKKGTFVASRATMRGTPGGTLSPELRDIVDVPVPLPIMFKTGTATMTPDGEAAAKELLRFLKAESAQEFILIGHTDERGGVEYNMKLSEQRVRRVAQWLGENGVNTKISVIAKGKSEPFNRAFAPPNATRDELYALDRRVEIKIP